MVSEKEKEMADGVSLYVGQKDVNALPTTLYQHTPEGREAIPILY